MKGFAIVKTATEYKKVPLDSDDETGNHPLKTKDGEDVWKWSTNEANIDTLISRLVEFRSTRGASRDLVTADRPAAKGGKK